MTITTRRRCSAARSAWSSAWRPRAGATTTATPRAVGRRRPPTSDLDGTITVFAAASLTDAFGEAADDFEDDQPRTSPSS